MPVRRAVPCILLALAALAAGGCARRPTERTIDGGRMGAVRLLEPPVAPVGLVFLVSGDSGWDAALTEAAQALAARGAVVVGVDLPAYLRGLAASDDGCHYLVSEIEDLSKRLQHDLGFEAYRSPIVAGVGAGATLAYAALAQAPAATLAGAAGSEPLPPLATRVPLCPGATASKAAGGFVYAPSEHLPGWWEGPAGTSEAAARVGAAVTAHLAAAGGEAADTTLRDIPVTELPAAPARDTLAVIYSGDGGWRDIDKQIGEVLARSGIPVVGIDSLRYFWRARQPEGLARDLEHIIAHYGDRWHTRRTLLVGYSFGADVLPFIVNRLPEKIRATVVQVSLLGLGSHASFEFHVSGWLGAGPRPEEPPVLPEAARLDLARVQCFYGADESDTLCPELGRRGAEVIRTTGGHHFDGDWQALARQILKGLATRDSFSGRSGGRHEARHVDVVRHQGRREREDGEQDEEGAQPGTLPEQVEQVGGGCERGEQDDEPVFGRRHRGPVPLRSTRRAVPGKPQEAAESGSIRRGRGEAPRRRSRARQAVT